jgi:hypothetical protein
MSLGLYHQSTDNNESTEEKWRKPLGVEGGGEDFEVADRHVQKYGMCDRGVKGLARVNYG